MAMKKLSISLSPDVAAAISQTARRHGESTSAWIERAARLALQREDGLAAMDEYEREFGAFTPEEIAAADAILDEDFGPHRSEG
jgi:predicted transcriptional regulator